MEYAQDQICVSVTKDGGERIVVPTARRTPGVRIARNNVTVAATASAIRIQGTVFVQQDTQASAVKLNARMDPMDLTVSFYVNVRTAPRAA